MCFSMFSPTPTPLPDAPLAQKRLLKLCFLGCCAISSRMRSKGFPFIVGGLGVGAVVVCRRLSSFVVVVASQIRCHWGKLLQVTLRGGVTCQFAPLFHCDLQDNDMSRKKRKAFRCTGAAFGEICRLLRSSIGISVWRVVFLGCWMWPSHWDLRCRVWRRSSVFVTSLSWNGDFGGWECAQNGPKSFQTCGVVRIFVKLTWDDIVTFRGRRRTLCGFWGVEVRFSWQAQDSVGVRRADAERFVAGAGNREVVSHGTQLHWD